MESFKYLQDLYIISIGKLYFFNRRKEMKELKLAAEMFRLGNPLPIAVIGLRRIG